MTRPFARLLLPLLALAAWSGAPPSTMRELANAFAERYAALDVEAFTLDVRERLQHVANSARLAEQDRFFTDAAARLTSVQRADLRGEDRVLYDLMAYEIGFHRDRIALEQRWARAGRPMPVRSLHELPEHEAWYRLLVRRFTSTDISPEEVFAMGEREIRRCLDAIDTLRRTLGFTDSASFQQHLAGPDAWITDRAEVLSGFARIDSTVRKHLHGFAGELDVPEVHAMEWPDAGAYTPPGMYLARDQSALNTAVFQYNFYQGRFPRRAMAWIYLHEAIPGHHLQWTVRNARPPEPLQAQLLYPGNFEGWACYVEYYGADLGVYTDPSLRLGKWEWDLVRSERLVLDVGINYYGWSKEQALAHWKHTIPGQDAIAEREVMRVTNWAAQALSYKVGADRIQRMREMLQGSDPHFSPSRFHRAFLGLGQVPISVAELNIEAAYRS